MQPPISRSEKMQGDANYTRNMSMTIDSVEKVKSKWKCYLPSYFWFQIPCGFSRIGEGGINQCLMHSGQQLTCLHTIRATCTHKCTQERVAINCLTANRRRRLKEVAWFVDRQLLCLLRRGQRVCMCGKRSGGGYSIDATSGLISHSFAVATTWHRETSRWEF